MRVLCMLVVCVCSTTVASGQVRISQCYGGGGNSGSTLTHDFVELINLGTVAVDLAGWSVQYASATGSTWQVTPLAGSIQPLHYFLIQEASGGGGSAPLPPPDAIGTISMSATAGKIALTTRSTPLSGSCPLPGDLVDLVGFGSNASCYEGVGPAPAAGSTTSIMRHGDGAVDTDNNKEDFAAGTPDPRNSGSTPLPVQLHSLTATVGDAGSVRLEWGTFSEVQNFGFEVQRSMEPAGEFETLPGSFIPGGGTTGEPRTYAYTDVQVAPGTWYYRLRQVDLNGGIHHSHAVRAEVPAVAFVRGTGGVEGLMLQNIPNPFNPATTVGYALPHRAYVRLQVFNIIGYEVATLVREVREAGNHTVRFDGTGLASGVYLCRLQAGSEVRTAAMLLLR